MKQTTQYTTRIENSTFLKGRFILLLAGFLVLFSACALQSSVPTARVTLAVTGGVYGALEPCG